MTSGEKAALMPAPPRAALFEAWFEAWFGHPPDTLQGFVIAVFEIGDQLSGLFGLAGLHLGDGFGDGLLDLLLDLLGGGSYGGHGNDYRAKHGGKHGGTRSDCGIENRCGEQQRGGEPEARRGRPESAEPAAQRRWLENLVADEGDALRDLFE